MAEGVARARGARALLRAVARQLLSRLLLGDPAAGAGRVDGRGRPEGLDRDADLQRGGAGLPAALEGPRSARPRGREGAPRVSRAQQLPERPARHAARRPVVPLRGAPGGYLGVEPGAVERSLPPGSPGAPALGAGALREARRRGRASSRPARGRARRPGDLAWWAGGAGGRVRSVSRAAAAPLRVVPGGGGSPPDREGPRRAAHFRDGRGLVRDGQGAAGGVRRAAGPLRRSRARPLDRRGGPPGLSRLDRRPAMPGDRQANRGAGVPDPRDAERRAGAALDSREAQEREEPPVPGLRAGPGRARRDREEPVLDSPRRGGASTARRRPDAPGRMERRSAGDSGLPLARDVRDAAHEGTRPLCRRGFGRRQLRGERLPARGRELPRQRPRPRHARDHGGRGRPERLRGPGPLGRDRQAGRGSRDVGLPVVLEPGADRAGRLEDDRREGTGALRVSGGEVRGRRLPLRPARPRPRPRHERLLPVRRRAAAENGVLAPLHGSEHLPAAPEDFLEGARLPGGSAGGPVRGSRGFTGHGDALRPEQPEDRFPHGHDERLRLGGGRVPDPRGPRARLVAPRELARRSAGEPPCRGVQAADVRGDLEGPRGAAAVEPPGPAGGRGALLLRPSGRERLRALARDAHAAVFLVVSLVVDSESRRARSDDRGRRFGLEARRDVRSRFHAGGG